MLPRNVNHGPGLVALLSVVLVKNTVQVEEVEIDGCHDQFNSRS